MEERREGDDFHFEQGSVQFVLGNVRESSGDLTAVVRAYYLNGRGPVPLLAPSRLNLVAPRSRAELARTIAKGKRGPASWTDDTWGDLVEEVCGRTYVLWERGDPIIDMSEVESPPWSGRYCIDPMLPEGETTIVVADGGTGKSTYATALMASKMLGIEIIPGMRPSGRGMGLYLDWESNKHEHNRRLRSLCRGAGVEGVPPMLYRTNYRALAEDIGTFRREVATHDVGFVVVDSAVPASGDEIKDTAAPRQLFNGLRSLGDGVTRLVLAHMSKAEAEKESGRARVLGSIMYENLARSVWEMRRSEFGKPGELVIGLYHRKMNGGRLRQPMGYRVLFGEDEQPYRFERVDLNDYQDLHDRLPEKDRLKDFLRTGARTTKEIAEHLGKSQNAARMYLRRHPDITRLSSGGGTGINSLWALRAPEPTDDLPWE